MGFLLRSNPLDKTLLINYRYHRKKYKKLLNHKKKLFESNFMHKLEHNTNNPAAFWKLLNQHCKNDKRKDNSIKITQWIDSRQNKNINKDQETHMLHSIEQNINSVFNDLNFSITSFEIFYALNQLKKS